MNCCSSCCAFATCEEMQTNGKVHSGQCADSTPRRTHIFSAHASFTLRMAPRTDGSRTRWAQVYVCVPEKKFSLSHSLSLLGVPHLTSTLCAAALPLSPPTQNSLTGIRHTTQCAIPRLGGSCGHVANTAQLTGCVPRTCIDASSEHTPINIALRRENFHIESHLKFAV